MSFANRIRPSVQTELNAAVAAEIAGSLDAAFWHLRRAHVLGQAATTQHVRAHWWMLKFALRHRLTKEALGQVWRLVAAAIFTGFGMVPEGNTGSTDISGFRRLPLPSDLKQLIDAARD